MFNPVFALIGFCIEKLGLARWCMTHGPGSIGSIAKSMAKAYNRAKEAYPTVSQDELLFVTLKSRYTVLGLKNLTDDDMTGIVNNSGGSLAKLSIQVVILENPAASNALLSSPQTYATMVEIVEEVTAKFALGA